MQNPLAAPINPKVGPAKFNGSKKANADSHVGQFETRWQASGYAVHPDDVKKEHFAATLEGKVVSWFTQYGLAHFADYNALKTAFLARFRKEKTSEDVLKKLKELKQKKLGVEDYSQKFINLYNRLAVAQRPTAEQLGDYFCKDLRQGL